MGIQRNAALKKMFIYFLEEIIPILILLFTANALDDLSEFTGNRVAVFSLPPLECHWIGKTWGVIKEDVRELVGAVEITMRDTILPTEVYGNGK